MKVRTLLVLFVVLALGAPLLAQGSVSYSKGLRMAVQTDRERYEPGQPVDIVFTLTNETNGTLNYEFGNTPIYDLWITGTNGQEIWRSSRGRVMGARERLSLQPYESKVYRETWYQTDNTGKTVAAGWYEVHASFSLADRNSEPMKTRIRIDERLSTGPIVILVPVGAGVISPTSDIGKSIEVEGVLKQGPQGLYIEVRTVNVKR